MHKSSTFRLLIKKGIKWLGDNLVAFSDRITYSPVKVRDRDGKENRSMLFDFLDDMVIGKPFVCTDINAFCSWRYLCKRCFEKRCCSTRGRGVANHSFSHTDFRFMSIAA